MKINLILLAAGSSRRFGSNKLLYEFEGKLMYRHIVDEIAKLKDDVFAKKIVISQYNEILSGLSKEGYMAIRNTESQLGISYSIQLGINAAKGRSLVFSGGGSAISDCKDDGKFCGRIQKKRETLRMCAIWRKKWESVYFYKKISGRVVETER